VTTTGGPEHSVAEPVANAPLEGDDIVVVPDLSPPRRRSRVLLVSTIVVVLVTAGIAIAVASTRDDNSSAVRSAAPPRSPATQLHPSARRATKPKRAPKRTPIRTPPTAVAQLRGSTPVAASPPPPPPVAPTQPPVTAPPSYPPSALQWSATPAALTIKSGGHASFTVHVTNPTNGTVMLPHPLSCAPTLRGPKGHTIGFAVCEEMAQVMAPHDALTQRYVITASSDGTALAPGTYTASVEDLFDVKVAITAP